MVDYIKSDGRGSVCAEIANNYKEDVEELLAEQAAEGSEAWRLLVEGPNKTRATHIRTGRKGEIDTDDIRDAVDDFDFVGIERIISIHTHPKSSFLSPKDIATHARFVGEFDSYVATVGVHDGGDEVDVFGVENEGKLSIKEQNKIDMRMREFHTILQSETGTERLHKTVAEMLEEMDRWLDFCEVSYDKEDSYDIG